jgi:hypothetical protein
MSIFGLLLPSPWSLALPSVLSIQGADDFMKSTIIFRQGPQIWRVLSN